MNLGIAHNGTARFPLMLDNSAKARHLYVIGQTGTGKTNFLQNMMAQETGGFCFIDPHGDAAETVIAHLPQNRGNDLIYIDLSDIEHPPGISFLSDIHPDKRGLVADNIVSAFVHIWGNEAVGNRSQQVLRNSLHLLMGSKQTLLAIPKLLTNSRFRHETYKTCPDPVVLAYWRDQFDRYDDRKRDDVISPILNKLDALLVPQLREIISQQADVRNQRKPLIDIKHIMDNGQVLIVNLSKGQVGENAAHLFGALIVSSIAQTALARAEVPEAERVPFTLYADEFQDFATSSFALVLSEARKYRLALVLAHQFISQVPEAIQQSVFGNCGTLCAFRCGADDAPIIARQFNDTPDQFKELPNYQALIRTLKDGAPGNVVRLDTAAPKKPEHDGKALIQNSRVRFGRNRGEIEERIAASSRQAYSRGNDREDCPVELETVLPAAVLAVVVGVLMYVMVIDRKNHRKKR